MENKELNEDHYILPLDGHQAYIIQPGTPQYYTYAYICIVIFVPNSRTHCHEYQYSNT